MTKLVSVGIGWYQQSIKYHSQYDSSNMKVSSQYGSGGFLSVWYHHSTDSGDFHETFYAFVRFCLIHNTLVILPEHECQRKNRFITLTSDRSGSQNLRYGRRRQLRISGLHFWHWSL